MMTWGMICVADHDHDFGLEFAQVFDRFRAADAFRLIDGNAVTQRSGFHRRRRQFLFAAFGAIWLRNHQRHVVAGGEDALQRGHGEFGSAEEDYFHITPIRQP